MIFKGKWYMYFIDNDALSRFYNFKSRARNAI